MLARLALRLYMENLRLRRLVVASTSPAPSGIGTAGGVDGATGPSSGRASGPAAPLTKKDRAVAPARSTNRRTA